MKTEQKIPIFTVPDIVRFLKWAANRYRLEGVVGAGDETMISIINEYVKEASK